MTYRGLFDAKVADTAASVTFSFALDLAPDETLSSASVTATVYSGTDLAPAAIISGAATITASQVSQIIIDGLEGVTYLLTCSVETSYGATLIRDGYLVVVSEEL